MTLLDVRVGDLLTARADALVTSANTALRPAGGLDGAVHRAAGPDLAVHCAALGGCAVGEARTTPASGALQARSVIHAVAPHWKDGTQGERELLAATYGAVVAQADAHGCRTVALPSLGTGAAGIPADVAAAAAVAGLEAALLDDWGARRSGLRLIRFWVADEPTRDAYRRAIDGASARLRPRHRGPVGAGGAEPTSATRPLPYSRPVDEDDETLLRAGLAALEMEEKWVGYCVGDHLHLVRSWTGYEIFSVRLRPRTDGLPGAIVDQLHVCDDRERYTPSGDAEALATFEGVLGRVLRL